MKRRIYLDHAATSPILPEARAALLDGLDRWANPSSAHADGRTARAALEDARSRIKAALGWRGDLIFTSGASEAAALAFRRTRGPQPILSTVEHDSVLRQVPEAGRISLGVTKGGLVDLAQLAYCLRGAPGAMVAVQHCNPETGVVQPIPAIIEAVASATSHLLVDCSQSAGKLPLPPGDLIIVSAHKLGGPPGVGALLVRDLRLLEPQGGQERGYRAGTENLPAILGFAAALEAVVGDLGMVERQEQNRASLETTLEANGATTLCRDSPRSPFIGAYHMPGMSAMAQLVRLDALGFSVSAGSACSSGSTRPSHVLAALGLDPAFAANVIRVSFGKDTRRDEVMAFAAAWVELAREARKRAA